jgi:hypothetical protein
MAVMRGVTVGVEKIEVRRSGVVRLTIDAGHMQQPCTVVFAGMDVSIE